MREHRLYTAIVITCGVLFSSDFLWTLFEGKEYSLFWGYVLNILYFCALAMTGYLWLLYVHSVMRTKISQEHWVRVVAAIPMLVFVLATVSSYWTGWIFYIDGDHMYHRGSLYVIQTIVGYGYMLWSALSCSVRAMRKENFVYRTKYLVLGSVIVFPAIFGVIQIVMPGLPTLGMGFTLAIVHVYMGMQQDMITEDPLTGIHNYTRMLQYLSEKIRDYIPGEDLCMMVIQLRDVKKISRTFGINETDEVLIDVANGLERMVKGERYFLCRYANSKFALICYDTDPLDTGLLKLSLEKEIDLALAEKPYHVSYTISFAHYDDSITSLSRFIRMAETK
jgi:diguanylate cyclase (GGDEF)-like protein